MNRFLRALFNWLTYAPADAQAELEHVHLKNKVMERRIRDQRMTIRKLHKEIADLLDMNGNLAEESYQAKKALQEALTKPKKKAKIKG